jgi:hypothetical protein
MMAFLRNHPAVLFILLPVILFVSVLELPPDEFILAMVLLLFGLAITGIPIAQKHRRAYLRGQTTKATCLRNILLEYNCVLCAMAVAGLLGRTIAELATGQVSDGTLRFVAGLLIALSVGIVVGIFARRAWVKILRFY